MRKFYSLLVAVVLFASASVKGQLTQSFTYTGANQTFLVPPGVTSIDIKAWGAGGGGANFDASGGTGALVKGTIAVTPGQSLVIVVGGGGQYSVTAGGFGGGGNSGSAGYGASGGGYSGIFLTSISQANAFCVAGAGGGGGYYSAAKTYGGAGGALNGTNGGDRTAGTFQGGRGATAAAGGAAGAGTTVGTAGTALTGGKGGVNTCGGGGGGGGYYGGGGGYGTNLTANYSSGGGGGSSFLGVMTATTNTVGVTGTSGAALQAPGSAETGYVAGVGNGGAAGANGGNGLVILTYTPPACTAPTVPTSLSLTPISVNQVNGTITASGSPTGYIVVAYPTGSAVTAPSTGTSYTAGTALGLGTVVYSGTGLTFSATGLTGNTTYDFYAYAYNNTSCTGPVYSTTAATATTTTLTCPAYSGTIPIGATGTFTSLTNAISSLLSCGYTGNIVLELESDYSSAGETYPIVFPAALPTSAVKTITVKPGAGVNASISGSSTTFLIKILQGFITIDGSNNGTTSQNLTITNTSATTPGVLWLGSTGTTPVTDITIKNTFLINGAITNTAVMVSDGAAAGTAGYFNNITFQNNNVQKASTGIYIIGATTAGNGSGLLVTGNTMAATGTNAILGIGIYVQGVDGSAVISNNTLSNFANSLYTGNMAGIWLATATNNCSITGNTISGFVYSAAATGYAPFGILIGTATGTNISVTNNTINGITSNAIASQGSGIYSASPNTTITGNTVTGISSSGGVTNYGIFLTGVTGTNVISANNVNNITNSGGSPFAGICVQGASTGVTLYNNRVTNIKNGTTYGAYGFQLASSSTTANIKMYNNFISDITGTGNGTLARNGHGIFVSAGGGYTIDYNSVYLNNSQTNAAGITAAIYITAGVTAAGAITSLQNNIFSNNGTVGTPYAIYSAAANTVYGTIDYNDYWSAGANFGFLGAGTNTVTPGMTTAFGGNTNSQNILPVFTSGTDLHLVPTSNSALNDLGSASSTTTTVDIDGDTRPASGSTRTDMGADEYIAPIPPVIANVTVPVSTCTATSHVINADVTTVAGTIASVVLNYNNGSAGSVAMTLVSGNTYTGTIPAASPVNATVTWSITATNSAGTPATYTGTSYKDAPATGYTATASATNATVCSGSPTALSAILSTTNTTSPTYTTPPAVTNATTDEDLGNITITQGATTILNNTTPINSLVGTIGTATGTAGSYSNFTAFGPYGLTAGKTYNFSATVLQQVTAFSNAIGIYIDYNRNGVFTDPGEAVYVSPGTTAGGHTESGTFTVPATAALGYTRMRIVVNEGAVTGPTMAVSYGEYEEYMINLSGTTGATAYSWSDGASVVGTTNPLTVSPITNTTYTATVTYLSCPVVSNGVSIAVNPLPSAPTDASIPAQCGAPTFTATSAATTPTFNFYSDAAGTMLVATNTTGVYSPVSYVVGVNHVYVSVTSAGCTGSLATLTVISSVAPAVTLSQTGTVNTCIGTIQTITASSLLNYYTIYSWAPTTNLYQDAAGTVPYTGQNLSTVYYKRATTTAGETITATGSEFPALCSSTASVTFVVSAIPSAPVATASATGVCSGVAVTLTASAASGTCALPTYSFPGATGDYIGNVTFAGINNTTGDAATDYTSYAASATVTGGSTYPISLLAGGASALYAQQFGVWIDYNQNGVFEASEFVYASSVSTFSPTASTGNITIPLTAYNGATKMRIESQYSTALTSGQGCGAALTFGETEDYNITISGGTANPNIVTYVWKDETNTTVGSGSPLTINPTVTHTYTAVATNTGNCSANSNAVTVTIVPPMNGLYSVGSGNIGGEAGHYPTLTAAVAAYNSVCIAGPVTFALTDANYSGAETFPITINNNAAASSTNTLTIKPNTGVAATISGAAASTALIRILNPYTTIDGSNNGSTSQDLTITNISATSPNVLWIGSTGTTLLANITVKNTYITNGVIVNPAVLVMDGTTFGNNGYFSNFTFQNNNVQTASYGLLMLGATQAGNGAGTLVTGNTMTGSGANTIIGTGITLTGIDGPSTISNNTISNLTNSGYVANVTGITLSGTTNNCTVSGNTISNLTYSAASSNFAQGIYVSSTTGTSIVLNNNTISNVTSNGTLAQTSGIFSSSPNSSITNNTISGISGTYATGATNFGIFLNNLSGTNTVSGNTISNITNSGAAAVSGLCLQGTTAGVNVFNNKITNIKNTNAGGYGAYGMQLSSSSTAANTKVFNNFISDIAGVGVATVARNGYGIVVNGGAGYTIDYNSVYMNTNQTAAAGISADMIVTAGASAAAITSLQNNIFDNEETVGNNYGLYSLVANTYYTTIDYNDYYATSGKLGFLTSAQTTIAGMQAAFGQNANSVSIQPVFTSGTDLHLVPASNQTLNDLGSASSTTTSVDIDADVRPASGSVQTDMGADEFTPPIGLDMGVTALTAPPVKTCYTNAETVTVTIKNYSINTIDFSVYPVTVTVNVTGAVTQTFTTTLTSGTLASNATLPVPMPGTLDMSTVGVYTFNANTAIGGGGVDVTPANDALTPAATRTVTTIVAGTVSSSVASYCVTGGTPTLTLTGSAGGSIQWQESTTSSTGPWNNVGTGTTTYTPGTAIAATTYYHAVVSCATSMTSNVVTVTLNNPLVLTTTPNSHCGPGTVTLGATGSGGSTLNWYAAATGGTPLGSGTSFTTPSISANTTYYVDATSGTTTGTAGFAGNATTNNGTSTGSHGIAITTTTTNVQITNVTIPFTGTGTITIALKDVTNTTVISSVTTGTVTGTGTTPLSIPISLTVASAGNYLLIVNSISGTVGALGYVSTASYPYTVPGGSLSITSGYWYGVDAADNMYIFRVGVTVPCTSGRASVLASITTPPALAVDQPTVPLCNGSSAVVNVTAGTVGNYTAYSWSPTTALIASGSPSGSTITVNPTTTTTYTVTGTEPGGCVNTATVAVTVNPLPTAVTITPSSATICSGTVQSLTASGGTTTTSAVYNFGTQAATNTAAVLSTDYPAPYSVYYGGQRMQMLVKAAELTAAGFVAGSTITNIQFPVISLGANWGSSITSLQNFQVSIGTTALTTLAAFQGGLTQVVAPANFTPVVGYNNTQTFSTPFVWNGASNLIIETTFSNAITGAVADAVYQYNSPTAYQSTIVYRVDGVAAATVATTATVTYSYSARPDFKLNGTTTVNNPFTWSPAAGLYTNLGATTPYTLGNPSTVVYAKPGGTTTYTATATSASNCTSSNTVTVNVTPQPDATISYSGSPFCSAGTATVTMGGTYGLSGGTFSISGVPAAINSATGAINLSMLTNAGSPYTITYTVAAAGGCSIYTAPTTAISINPGGNWLGLDNNWFNTANWCGGTLPVAGTNVTIPAGLSNYPIIASGNAIANTVSIQTGASIIVNGTGIFSLHGALTTAGTGTINLSAGTLDLAGGSIGGSSIASSGAVQNLTLSGGAASSIITGATNMVSVTGTVTYTSGNNTFNTNDNLTLVSTAAGTAAFGDMTNNGAASGNTISGKVTVERYIGTTRHWQFLSIPTNTVQTVRASWMEGGLAINNAAPGTSNVNNPKDGYGTFVTDNAAGAVAAGFDAQSVSGPSLKYPFPVGSGLYLGISNPSASISAQETYFNFVRGPRNSDGLPSNQSIHTPTTLRTTGSLKTGAIARPVTAGVITPVGNPYAAEIDVDKVMTSATGLGATLYVWDPKLTLGYGLGAFQTIQKIGGNYQATPGGGSYPSGNVNFIESGQAFFVQGAGGGNVNFAEPQKTLNSANVNFTAGSAQLIQTSLLIRDASNNTTLLDGSLLYCMNGFNNGIDYNDGTKINNTGENVSILSHNALLAIEQRQPVQDGDTVHLNVTSYRAANYRWIFNLTNMDEPGRFGFMVDQYTGTEQALDLNGTNTYDFTVVNVAGSYAANRFYIVFRPAGVVPVTFTTISAARQADKTILVKWNTENELSLNHYETERSGNGTAFSSIGSSNPTNNAGGSAAYSLTDVLPLTGDNYYRIKGVSNNGHVQYSAIVKVVPLEQDAQITVYPNPMSDRVMNVKFTNKPAGAYTLQLLNKAGQTVYSDKITVSGINDVKTITFNKRFAAGSYQLIVRNEIGERTVIQVVME